jgi:hypothetical protein
MVQGTLINDPVLNNKELNKMIPIATYLAGVGIYTPNTLASANASEAGEPTFLEGKDRGVIRILPLMNDGGKGTMHEFLAEDVQVKKTLPLKTQPTLDGQEQGVDSSSGSESSTGDSTTAEASTDPFIKINFKITVTKNGYKGKSELSRAEFMKKRATWLRDIENTPVQVSSEMFDTMKTMQITSLGYTIAQGDESAIYEVELTEIIEPVDEDVDKIDPITSDASKASNYTGPGTYFEGAVFSPTKTNPVLENSQIATSTKTNQPGRFNPNQVGA